MSNQHSDNCPQIISRRKFIKLATLAGLLAGCRPARVAVTATPAPAVTPSIGAVGRVAQASHSGVWQDDALNPQVLEQMLDTALMRLTNASNASAAWSALFQPIERIAIKVNTIDTSDYWTRPLLVEMVTARLQEAGVPAEQIVVYDRSTAELERAGYQINRDGPGVRCYGTDGDYDFSWSILDEEIGLSNILLNSDALINMPLLKEHALTGISFSLKNHYGTFNRPDRFHRPRIYTALAELNSLPPIKDRTRLIIGDALEFVTPGWSSAWSGESLLASFDPVAHDVVGAQLFRQAWETNADNMPIPSLNLLNNWLPNCAEAGLGTNDPNEIEWIRSVLN